MLEQLNKIKYQIQNLKDTQTNADNKIVMLQQDLVTETDKLGFVLETRQAYKKAIDIVYERSVQELKDVLNSALNFVFFDRNYEMDIVLTDKRGKSLSFILQDNGKPVSLKTGTGMGIKCVISAILHIYYLQCKNSKILLLDEAYSNISKKYVSNFFEFLTQLCDNLDFKIIMITHDPRFLEYGRKNYIIDNGEVSVSESVGS